MTRPILADTSTRTSSKSSLRWGSMPAMRSPWRATVLTPALSAMRKRPVTTHCSIAIASRWGCTEAMGKLTTHVLDTAHGRPGTGIAIRLYRCANDGRQLLGSFTTNTDGRCDAPLLADAALQVGTYELEFAAGDYFAGLGVALAEPRFLDVVSLR